MPLPKREPPLLQRTLTMRAEHGREMAQIPRLVKGAMRGALADPRRRVTDVVQDWLLEREAGDKVTRKAVAALLRELRRPSWAPTGARLPKTPPWVEEIRHSVGEALARTSMQASAMAVGHVEQQTARLGLDGLAARERLALVQGVNTGRLSSAASAATDNVYADVQRQFMLGALRGETVQQMATRIQRTGGLRGALPDLEEGAEAVASTATQIGESLFGRAANLLDRVLRTETAETYNEQAVEAMDRIAAENATEWVVKKRWDASNDANMCDECGAMNGETVDLDEDFSGGVDNPPLHPNCLCNVTVWTERKDVSDGSEAE